MINQLIRGIFVAFVGVLLIFLNESVMPFLVRLLGVAFLLPALFSLMNLYMTRKEALLFPMLVMSFINIGSVLLGVLLIIFPVAFIELFVILLALMLLGISLLQIYGVVLSYRLQRYGLGLFVVPVLLAVVSIVVLFNPFSVISTASIIIGICLVVSGVSDIAISIFTRNRVSTDLQKR